MEDPRRAEAAPDAVVLWDEVDSEVDAVELAVELAGAAVLAVVWAAVDPAAAAVVAFWDATRAKIKVLAK